MGEAKRRAGAQAATPVPGSVLVYTRSLESLKHLHDMTAPPTMAPARNMAQAWLDAPEIGFFMLGSTGGLNAQVFTIAAEDEDHLLNDVLMQAAALMDTAAYATSTCTAVDAALHHKVDSAWEAIKMPRAVSSFAN